MDETTTERTSDSCDHEFQGRYGLGRPDLLGAVFCDKCGRLWDVTEVTE